MYYNNDTAQHNLLREKIIENGRNYNSLQRLTDYIAAT